MQAALPDRSQLTVNSPRANAAGPVPVAVTNDNGEFTLPGGFVYYDAARPDFAVAGVAPAAGPVAGGNDVFIAGSGFTAATEVAFDGRAVPCERLDAHRLHCTAPPAFAGPVDVDVTEGGQTITVEDGYTYFETLELIAVQPDRGAVAGGTVVTLSGLGFVDGMQVRLGDLELLDVVVIDETTAIGVTPPNTPGPVDVRVSTAFSRALIPAGYNYFDPITRFGGVWGEPIDGAVNVTVLNAGSGQPEAEAVVLLLANDGDVSLEGLSNAQGQLTLSAPGLRGPARVTAAKEGFEVTTVEDVEAENVTIYLLPNDGDGAPPPGVPAAILRGVVSGLDLLPKPVDERYVNIVVIETSHFTPYDRSRMPAPGPGGLLFEDGPFEIIARPGELAIVATAGEIDRDTLKDFQDGLLGYWDMRTALRPLQMGLRRFISASPGVELDGLDVELDHRMDFVIPVDLDNPPLGAAPGPQYYGVLPRLNLGAEGYWELDTQAVSVEPNLSLRQMPRLDGWDADIEYYLISLAFSDTADNTPMAITIEQTRDVDAGVFVTPFVGAPFFINPGIGGNLGVDRHVTWGVSDGFDGPIHVPSANLVTIEEPALGPPKPLWRYVTPSLVTEFDVPVLPESAGNAGLGRGLMYLNIFPFIVDGEFDFDDFTYDELSQFRWKSWGVATTTFRP
ncbi:MAG: IPT/TIG domain-containing protein [bacterium]